MRAGATLIVVAGAAVIAAGAYAFLSGKRYIEAVDARAEREIADADLSIIRVELLEHRGDTAAYLRQLYRGPANEELNNRFARLIANWTQNYPRLARIPLIPDGLTDMEVLGAEIDQRFGPGVFAVMQDEYTLYRREAPQREAARRAAEEASRAEANRVGRYVDEYYREHGTLPRSIPVNP